MHPYPWDIWQCVETFLSHCRKERVPSGVYCMETTDAAKHPISQVSVFKWWQGSSLYLGQPKGKMIMKQNQDCIFIKAKSNMPRFKDIHLPVFFKFNEKECYFWRIISVQLLSRVRLFSTPWTAAHHASLSITNSRSPPKPMSVESVMPSSHLILCHPLLLLPSIFPSNRVFSNESAFLIRWPKYWSFSFNLSPSSEDPGLISFRMDWLDLLAVQGTLKSLL